MSHQLQGERAGLVNADFDIAFLDDLTRNVDRLVRIPHVEYLREAGSEGAELVMWMIMRGALDDDAREGASALKRPRLPLSAASSAMSQGHLRCPDCTAVK